MKIGVIACSVMKMELDKLLQTIPEVSRITYLEVALHCYPQKMKEAIKEQIRAVQDQVDVVFLGYGYCQSLKGIEDEFEIPIVMPQMDDCIQILMTPQKYASEMRKEVGTWFMTPGWAEAGAEMVIKELRADRVTKYGKNPLEIAKRLFVHYRRGLYVDTGVGGNGHLVQKAAEFCEIFNLRLEKTVGTSSVLEQYLQRAVEIGRRRAESTDASERESEHDA